MAFVVHPVSNFLPSSEEMEGSGMFLPDVLLDGLDHSSTIAYRINLHGGFTKHNLTSDAEPSSGLFGGISLDNRTRVTWYSEDFLTLTAWMVVKVALLLVLAVSMVSGNVIVILAQASRPRPKAKLAPDNLYQYIVSASLVAIATGVFAVLYMVLDVSDAYWHLKYVCLTYHGYLTFIQIAGQGSLLLALLDCFAALGYPIRYPLLAARRRVTVAIILFWLYAIALAVLPVVWFNRWDIENSESCRRERVLKHTYNVFTFVHFVLIAVANVVLYVSVSFEIWQKRALAAVARLRQTLRQRYEESHQRAGQHAVAVIFSSLLYSLLWAPHVALCFLHTMRRRTSATNFVDEIVLVLGLLHCSVNPALLFFSLKPLRYGYRRLRCCAPERDADERSGVRLNGVSFRSRVTGSLLSLHTALDGRAVCIPHLVPVGGNDRGCGPNGQMAKGGHVQDHSWYTSSSGSSGVYSIGHENNALDSNRSQQTRRRFDPVALDNEYVPIPPPDYY